MEYQTLWKAGLKRHRGILAGIFVLVLLASLSLGTVLTGWGNSVSYLRAELDRAGFGDLTAWVSGVPDSDSLAGELGALESVERVETQRLIFSHYSVNGWESDSEGQLLPFAPGDSRYRFFTDDLSGYRAESLTVRPGEVYVSPSLISVAGVRLGDTVEFAAARNGGTVRLTVRGYYEDPFMGSSMIGMKGFLISQEDYESILETVQSSGIDALARAGAMLHLFRAEDGKTELAQWNGILNESTELSRYAEFVHSAQAIGEFMLILQNAFCGLIAAFVLVLLLVVLAVLGHSITGAIEADSVEMGVLKALGFSSTALRLVQLLQYAAAILPAMLLGLILTGPLSRLVSGAMLPTTGILIPARPPWGACLGTFAVILLLLAAFIVLKTGRIAGIAPMGAIRGGVSSFDPKKLPAVDGRYLSLSLAVRRVASGRKRYAGACMAAVLLVFFASLVGRMDAWLGPDGKGMMDAFNPADHDLGVQVFGERSYEEAQDIVLRYSGITDSYLLAMPGVTVNGTGYTANVIDQPQRFHILEGKTCTAENEIVVTEFVADALGVSIGDTLTVTGDGGRGDYTLSGIYTCANDMGGNIGMNRTGYRNIGRDDPQLWCHHYFLADPSQKAAITEALGDDFGGDVHVHENTWPGLFGIISAMQALLAFLYGMAALFIFTVTAMTGGRLLSAEQRDTGVYKALGFSSRQLRLSFALRFAVAALLGSALGTALAAMLTDPLVSTVMKLAGISNFISRPDVLTVLFPGVVMSLLFFGFAYLAAGRLKKMDLTVLIRE